MIVAGYQNSRNARQKLFLQSTSTSTPLDLDTMMLHLLELTQMQKLSQDDPRLYNLYKPASLACGLRATSQAPKQKYSHFLVNFFFK